MNANSLLIAASVAAALGHRRHRRAGADGRQAGEVHGVVKAGKNDCQTAASSCAGTSKKDAQERRLDLRTRRHLRQAGRRQHTAPKKS